LWYCGGGGSGTRYKEQGLKARFNEKNKDTNGQANKKAKTSEWLEVKKRREQCSRKTKSILLSNHFEK
jgi:hypothetical protein